MARRFLISGVVLGLAAMIAAPIVLGHGNEPGSSTVRIGGGEVKVDFAGPEAKGRDVLSLLPPGGYWRMGADRATTLTTDVDLKFGDMVVPKGTYKLVAYFGEDKTWSLIVAEDLGSGFEPTKVVGKVKGQVTERDAVAEHMTIKLEANGNQGKLILDWGKARLTAEFSAV